MALDTSIYGSYITTGLNAASNIVNSNTQKAYTPYTSSAANAPTQTQMYDYTQSSPLQQINAPNYTLSAGNAPQYQNNNYDTQAAQAASWQNTAYNKLGVPTPTYQGLMGGDYDALQSALMQPGQQSATNAYNTGTQNLINAMGGSGLYGSSIMAQQQIQGLDREYMNALASNSSNAAAQRYGMQQQDLGKAADMQMAGYQTLMGENTAAQQAALQQGLALNDRNMTQAQLNQQAGLANAQNRLTADKNQNDFGLNLYAQKLAEQKDMNAYNAQETAGLRDQALNTANVNFTQADSMNQYNNLKYNAQKEYDTNLNNWLNQQNYEKNFVYPQAASAYADAQREQMMNQALALAGQGAPLATAASNQELQSAQLAAQQAAAQQNYTAQLWGSAAGLLGTLGAAQLESDYTLGSNLGF